MSEPLTLSLTHSLYNTHALTHFTLIKVAVQCANKIKKTREGSL